MNRWTEKEIAKLHERKASGMTWEAIAKAHKRSVQACQQRWYKTKHSQRQAETITEQLELPIADMVEVSIEPVEPELEAEDYSWWIVASFFSGFAAAVSIYAIFVRG